MDDKSFFLLHIGAGYHSPKLNAAYRKLLKTAIESHLFQQAATAVEKSWFTNTGRGSNVDRNGYPSLDATYLKVENGKVADILSLFDICDESPTNIITQAKNWLDTEFSIDSISKNFGLLRPLSLVYSQLQLFAGLKSSDPSSLIRPSTKRAFEKVKECFDTLCSDEAGVTLNERTKRPRLSADREIVPALPVVKKEITQEEDGAAYLEQVEENKIEDTIGIVEVSYTNDRYEIEAVTSSGGTFFKLPGRVSCAGIYGAGIGFSCRKGTQVVCMCTGNGDDISRMNLASFLSDAIAANQHSLEETSESIGDFLVSSIVQRSTMFQLSAVDSNGSPTIYVGAVVTVITATEKFVVYCHSTESFYFAFRLKDGIEIVMSRKGKANGTFLQGEFKIH